VSFHVSHHALMNRNSGAALTPAERQFLQSEPGQGPYECIEIDSSSEMDSAVVICSNGDSVVVTVGHPAYGCFRGPFQVKPWGISTPWASSPLKPLLWARNLQFEDPFVRLRWHEHAPPSAGQKRAMVRRSSTSTNSDVDLTLGNAATDAFPVLGMPTFGRARTVFDVNVSAITVVTEVSLKFSVWRFNARGITSQQAAGAFVLSTEQQSNGSNIAVGSFDLKRVILDNVAGVDLYEVSIPADDGVRLCMLPTGVKGTSEATRLALTVEEPADYLILAVRSPAGVPTFTIHASGTTVD
jgi:hypothetical protein